MKTIDTENIVIVVLASIGVLVLLVMFGYLLRQIMKKE